MSDAQALQILFKSPVTDEMIRYLTNTTLKVLPCSKESYPSPPSSPGITGKRNLPSLMTFITKLVRYTNVYTSTLLTTVCYLSKLKTILPKDATGLPSTTHRIFLACLILSAKFHNDSSPLNAHWSRYTDGLFSLEDVNLMERQLLQLLHWDLRINQDALAQDLQWLLLPIKEDLKRSKKIRQQQLQQQQCSPRKYASTAAAHANRKNYNSTYPSPPKYSAVTPSQSHITGYPPVYYHQRNVSVCSSSSTLASRCNSSGSLDCFSRSSSADTLAYVPRGNSTSERTESYKTRTVRSAMEFEHDGELQEIMAQYGF